MKGKVMTAMIENVNSRAVLVAMVLLAQSVVSVWAAGEVYRDPKASPEARTEDLLQRLTPVEKLDYIGGVSTFYTKPIQRLGIPGIRMSDGPLGARCFGPSTAYPAGICVAASWNPEIARQTGVALGRDCRARGIHILLAPGVNIYRDSRCGRNFEYAGEDPFLAGMTVSSMILGLQSQGVLATVKHFACNNQETQRSGGNSEIDERTLREIYLPAFKAAVEVGKVGCVMNAYNKINGIQCTENSFLNTQILRKEWGFTGIVMSDWGATHDTVGAANGGLDLEMPAGKFMNREKLMPAIQDGRVTQATIDGKVRHILHTIITAGFLDRPQELKDIPKDDPTSARAALEAARQGIVLLQNKGNLLPLDPAKVKSVAVIGPNSHPAIWGGGGSSHTQPFHAVSVFDGIRQVNSNLTVTLNGAPVKMGEVMKSATCDDPVTAAKQADVAVVCVGFKPGLETEGRDRTYALPKGQMELIRDVAAANPRTIVVLNAGGGVDWQGWLDKVPVVLHAWYPGQEGGRAIAEILFGAVNPSGKLPVTFEKRLEDNPSEPCYLREADLKAKKAVYGEGLFVGYRGYDRNKIEPQFCFGFGLSYTKFEYSDLTVAPSTITEGQPVTVSFAVRNTGKRAGAEVAQLYINDAECRVPRPPQELKGFQRVELQPGEQKCVTITLSPEAMSFFDPDAKRWMIEPGVFKVWVGASSRDIRLKGSFTCTKR